MPSFLPEVVAAAQNLVDYANGVPVAIPSLDFHNRIAVVKGDLKVHVCSSAHELYGSRNGSVYYQISAWAFCKEDAMLLLTDVSPAGKDYVATIRGDFDRHTTMVVKADNDRQATLIALALGRKSVISVEAAV